MLNLNFHNIFKRYEIKYSHQNTRLTAIKDIPAMEIAGEKIDSVEENSFLEVKNWIADELVQTGLAKFDADKEKLNMIELQKTQVKESMQSPRRFSTLPENFYPKTRKFLKELSSEANNDPVKMQMLQKSKKLIADIVSSRQGKILILSSSLGKDENLLTNLSPEERSLYKTLHETVNTWRDSVLNC